MTSPVAIDSHFLISAVAMDQDVVLYYAVKIAEDIEDYHDRELVQDTVPVVFWTKDRNQAKRFETFHAVQTQFVWIHSAKAVKMVSNLQSPTGPTLTYQLPTPLRTLLEALCQESGAQVTSESPQTCYLSVEEVLHVPHGTRQLTLLSNADSSDKAIRNVVAE